MLRPESLPVEAFREARRCCDSAPAQGFHWNDFFGRPQWQSQQAAREIRTITAERVWSAINFFIHFFLIKLHNAEIEKRFFLVVYGNNVTIAPRICIWSCGMTESGKNLHPIGLGSLHHISALLFRSTCDDKKRRENWKNKVFLELHSFYTNPTSHFGLFCFGNILKAFYSADPYAWLTCRWGQPNLSKSLIRARP